MELKFAYDGTQKTDQLFQSYLYGIEIRYDTAFAEVDEVSIVPLWN